MQDTPHKSLTAYIREQSAYRLILPMITLLISGILLILMPSKKLSVTRVDNLTQAAVVIKDSRAVSFLTGPLYYTGMDFTSGKKVRARIYYSFEKGTCYYLILNASNTVNGDIIPQGLSVIASYSEDEALYSQLMQSMSQDLLYSPEDIAAISCPFFFNEYEYHNGLATFYIYSLHILLVLSLIGIIYIVIILIQPAWSFHARRLHAYGSARGLLAIAVAEFDSAVPVGRRNLYITDSFLIALLSDDIIIQPLDHITWLYQTHEVRHYHGHPKMFHTLCIVNDRKRTYKLPNLSESVIATLIREIASTRPSILIGNAWEQHQKH